MTRDSIVESGIGRGVSIRILDEAHAYFPYRTFAIGIRTQPKRQRKPSLKTVLDQARRAGATTVITPEGVTVTFGQQLANSEANPWDKVLPDAANKKRTP